MAVSSDALFSCLLEDLSPHLSYQEFCAILCEENCQMNPWGGLKRAAAVALANAFYKKYVDGASSHGKSAAFKKFVEMNNHCERYRLEDQIQTSWDDELLGEFKILLERLLYPTPTSSYEYYDILSEARNGPGSSIGVTGCDSYSKLFSSRGSTTTGFLSKYMEYFFSDDFRWHSALKLRRDHYGDPEIVEGSKLSFVPKNRDIMRSICTEPSLNMFYQLGLGKILEKRLKAYSGIDLSLQQERNRSLAQAGSATGRFATIDLSSASDTISVSLLREVLPKQLFEMLMKLRCKQTTFEGKTVALHMVSTMGNGFTFPLQTIIFTCAVLAVYRIHDVPIKHPSGSTVGNYGVNGDDIIVLSEMYRPVTKFLGQLGFFVNSSKSFSEGPFRESCGGDFFLGHNIRGVYVETLKSEQALAVLVNRLNEWTARTGIPLRSTVYHLLQEVRYQPVPLAENDDAGIKVPYSMIRKKKFDRNTMAVRYHRWVASPYYLTVDSELKRIFGPRHEKPRIFNEEGLWLTFLQGGLRSNRIPIRLDESARYKRRSWVCPNWDYTRISGLGLRAPDWDGSQLIAAIKSNLAWCDTP